MIVIVDYGMGNLRSAQKGFENVGYEAVISEKTSDVERAEAVVLPGVGAFADCYNGLVERNLTGPVIDAAQSGRPFLGICVGLQLLFEYSEEGQGSKGLGIFPGSVVRFPHPKMANLKVPHMGWNQLEPNPEHPCPLLPDADWRPYVYFVHSYHAQPTDDALICATSTYGVTFPAVVGRDNVYAVQFHPEKSQREGMKILQAFGRMAERES